MNIEEQVCTLEQAKKFYQLGVKQESLWFRVCPANPDIISSTYGVYWHEQAKDIIKDNEGDNFDSAAYSAFTISELAKMIGKGTRLCENWYHNVRLSLNCGLSFTIAYDLSTMADFIINQLQIKSITASEINARMV